jgi:sugar lactone lactonase YvrE
VDAEGTIYVADSGNHTIRRVTPLGAVTTLAGLAGSFGNADGIGNAARFWSPSGVALDSASNVYVADRNNNTIRKITPARVVTTLAGNASVFNQFGYPLGGTADGTGSDARFSGPSGVAVDSAGNVFVADEYNYTIRKITPARVVTTLAGWGGAPGRADGTGSDARFNAPSGVAVDSAGNVFVADEYNYSIRKGSPAPMGFLLFGPRIGFNSGQFGLFLTGSAGQSVVVEGSTDLMSWLPIWTNTFAGALNFVDPQSAVYSNRFYRARLP